MTVGSAGVVAGWRKRPTKIPKDRPSVSSQSPDMDDTPRGLDADQQDLFGTYDLGAFEADRIFATGYEMRR